MLDFLVQVHGVPVEGANLDAALRRPLEAGPDDLESRVQELATEVGLTAALVRRPLAEVLDEADPAYPWVAVRRGLHNRPEAIAVLKGVRGGALVVSPGAESRPSRWSRSSLRQWLSVPDDHQTVTWVLAEPAAPLSAMRAPEGATHVDPFVRLRALLHGERRTLWVAVVYSVVIGLLTLALPIAVQSVVNTLAFGSAFQPLVVLTIFVFVALVASTVMNTARAGVVEIIQRSIFARVSTDVTWRLLRVKAEAFDRYFGPELVNRFFDTVTVQKSAALLLIDGLSIVMQTAIGMVLLALYHPWLLAFDVLLVLGMVAIVVFLGRGAIHTSIGESKAKYALEAWLEQIADNLVTFKSPSGATYAVRRSQGLLEDYLTYRAKHFKILLRQIVGSFALQALASASLLGIGGWLVIERQLTLGQLVASELIVAAMMSAFTKFGKQLEIFYDLSAAIDKLGVLVDLPLERAGGEASLTPAGPLSLAVRDVEVCLPDSTAPALRIARLDVAPGEHLGVTGRTGAGKSTLSDLIFGLRTPDRGTVIVGGVDLRAVPLAELRRHVALVRDVELFPDSILDNVRLGRDDLSYDDIVAALRAVSLFDDVMALPSGLDTELHPYGRPLSSRQARRLMLARAIAQRPKLLILDGVLDQLYQRGERDPLIDLLFADTTPWTLICVSEREDLLARCRRVLTLDDAAASL